jgi:hypothetical protein
MTLIRNRDIGTSGNRKGKTSLRRRGGAEKSENLHRIVLILESSGAVWQEA